MKTDYLVELLTSMGPCLSSTLSEAIQRGIGVSPVAARKQIERAKQSKAIQAFGELNLKHGEQFLYLKEQGGTAAFRKALMTALEDSKSAYGRVIAGIMARGGIVPVSVFSTVSGLPVQGELDQLTADEALNSLHRWGLLHIVETKAGTCVVLAQEISKERVSDRRLIARLMVEDLVLAAIRDWFRLQGMTGTLASRRNDAEQPQFGYYQWDFVAPSYISALRTGSTNSKITPGFLVADIILGRVLSVQDVKYFIEKSNAIRKRLRNKPFIPFLIAEWFDIDALNLGRKHGFTFTTVKNLFGRHFYQAVKAMSQILEDHTRLDDTAKDFVDLVYSISHMNSTLDLAKDTIFELIVASIMTRSQYSFIEYHRVFNDFENHLQTEADILVHTDNSIKLFRCSTKEEPFDSVRNWFNVGVPIIHSVLSRQKANLHKNSFEYSYCSLSPLTPEILEFTKKINSRNAGYKIQFWDKLTLSLLVSDFPHLQQLFTLLTNQPLGEESDIVPLPDNSEQLQQDG